MQHDSMIPCMSTNRAEWIENVCKGFVHPSKANRKYYRIVLETLWPPGASIPGPNVSKNALDKTVERHRGGKRYRDLARRIREMQGEEGLVGLIRRGAGNRTYYQLISLDIKGKRTPRSGLNPDDWEKLLEKCGHECANCGRPESEIRLDPDHKIPRLRGGGDKLENRQPLCKECNNFKSTMCRNCELDCKTCPWAFPEKFAQIRLTQQNIQIIRKIASEKGVPPSEILNEIVSMGISARKAKNSSNKFQQA